MQCKNDGSILATEADEKKEPTEAEIEGNLSLHDELIEELHEHEGDPTYKATYNELVYDHKGFYSDLNHDSPYKDRTMKNVHEKTWLEK